MALIAIFALVTTLQQPYADVAADERAILLELFAATSGDGWTRRQNWGSAKPICEWQGVWCGYDADERKPVVAGLGLGNNNLRGSLPASLTRLTHLESLDVSRNHLTGSVPEDLLVRWDRHALQLDWSGNNFANLVTGVSVVHSPTGTLCSQDSHFTFDIQNANGRTVLQILRCADPGRSRRTYCFVREGTTYSLERFARALAQLGVRKFQSEYTYAFGFTTHAVNLTTSATWGDGTKTSVETYGRQGPLEVWMAQQLFLSLVAETSWEKEYKTATCRGWR